MSFTLSIIICVFNEEKTIEKLINKVEKCFLPNNFYKEIIIVDNNSTDNTNKVLKKYENNKNITIKYQKKNLGKGNSIIEGLNISNGDFVVFQDADLEYDPENYRLLLEKLFKYNLDAVFGSRSLNKSNYHLYKLNSFGTKFFTALINFLYNCSYTDTSTNHKLISSEVLKQLDLKSRGFELDFEIAIKLAKGKYKVDEIPISFHPRSKQEGKKVRISDGLKCLIVILQNYFK